MTIQLIGNTYKYEIEAVMKLFLPLERFAFAYDETPNVGAPSGDYCRVVRDENGLEVSVRVGDKAVRQTRECQADKDDELALCQMLYQIMESITGVTPPWGCLTGIRPVKKVHALMKKGLDKAGIFAALKRDYFVSDDKLELCYSTAVMQSGLLKTLDKRAFSLYVSIPFCPTRCSYCSFVSHSIESAGAKKLLPEYIEKLCAELEMTAAVADRLGLYPDTVYIGGGTPTSLAPEDLDRVMKAVKNAFDLSKIREYTVEAGRPDSITAEKLAVIKENGAARISVNPQTLNDDGLRAIGRAHGAEDFFAAFKLARAAGFDNINADIITGLPRDTAEGFKNTVDSLIGLEPESITVHTLTVKRSSALFSAGVHQLSERENLAKRENLAFMTDYARERLMQSGYAPYYLYRQKNTVSNLENTGYAKKGFESLYNIFIMDEIQTILAVGAAASTKLVNPETGKIARVFNCKYPYEYISRFDAKMREKERQITGFYV